MTARLSTSKSRLLPSSRAEIVTAVPGVPGAAVLAAGATDGALGAAGAEGAAAAAADGLLDAGAGACAPPQAARRATAPVSPTSMPPLRSNCRRVIGYSTWCDKDPCVFMDVSFLAVSWVDWFSWNRDTPRWPPGHRH